MINPLVLDNRTNIQAIYIYIYIYMYMACIFVPHSEQCIVSDKLLKTTCLIRTLIRVYLELSTNDEQLASSYQHIHHLYS